LTSLNVGTRSSTYTVHDSNSTINLAANDTVTVTNGNGIFQSSDFTTDNFQIDGQIHVTNGSGLRLDAMGNTVTAAFSSIITGNIGIFLNNGSADPNLAGNTIVTNGSINGSSDGIYNSDRATLIQNSGSIHGGDVGVVGVAYGIVVNNQGLGSIAGEKAAIDLSGIEDSSQQSKITNSGSISIDSLSGHAAILGSAGQDIVTNRGIIDGDVELGGGNDVFDARGGKVNGQIFGGDGNDTYLVDTADANIHEAATNDLGDTVEATVSYKLGDNIEGLILLGTARNGSGNSEANNIHGDNADNTLRGGAGEDLLSGGKGNDLLIGGADADTFDFIDGFGQDTIKHFETSGADHDLIALTDVSSITDFSDLKKHHLEQHHGDLIIDAGHGDMITLLHITKADLHAYDFTFGAL
jgi:Ca2+-binding RTX toxin-like protein